MSNSPATSNKYSETQDQTKDAFGFKWAKRDTYESESMSIQHKSWMIERYCGGDPSRLDKWLSGGGKTILDAGCGSSWSALIFFGDLLKKNSYVGVDISSAVDVAKQRFHEKGYPGTFIPASVFDVPLEKESVDIIFSEGVLHHTDSTEKAILSLSPLLKKGGLFLFYVYAKKGPLREFTDDYIRHHLNQFNDEEAWEILKPLTSLGMALGDLNVTVDVPEDVPFLGIKKGPIDVQRLFYWYFCKMYHRPEYTFGENHHINFDWYRPMNCHRHTPDEVKHFAEIAGLEILDMNIQESGLTVVAKKK